MDRDINEFVRKMQIVPTLSGDNPGQPLFDHFASMLPPDLPRSEFAKLSCLGYARLIVGELGGVQKARILWMQKKLADDETIGHAFVVPVDAKPDELAYNNTQINIFDELTVGEATKEGFDITEEVFNSPWSTL